MISNVIPSARRRRFAQFALFLGLAVGAVSPAAAQYDPVAQFSATSNPNGVWTYGFENVPLGSPFNILPVAVPVASVPGPFINSWQLPAYAPVAVLYNGTSMTQFVNTATDNAVYNPDTLAMHPGPNDQFGIVQFTAPVAGLYTIQGTFEGIDTAWISSDAYLLFNNSVIATIGVSSPFVPLPLSSGPLFLNAGDTLAYAVGGGPFHDTTALMNAEISAASIPEPSSFVLLGIACVAFAAWAWRRQASNAPRPSTCTS